MAAWLRSPLPTGAGRSKAGGSVLYVCCILGTRNWHRASFVILCIYASRTINCTSCTPHAEVKCPKWRCISVMPARYVDSSQSFQLQLQLQLPRFLCLAATKAWCQGPNMSAWSSLRRRRTLGISLVMVYATFRVLMSSMTCGQSRITMTCNTSLRVLFQDGKVLPITSLSFLFFFSLREQLPFVFCRPTQSQPSIVVVRWYWLDLSTHLPGLGRELVCHAFLCLS